MTEGAVGEGYGRVGPMQRDWLSAEYRVDSNW